MKRLQRLDFDYIQFVLTFTPVDIIAQQAVNMNLCSLFLWRGNERFASAIAAPSEPEDDKVNEKMSNNNSNEHVSRLCLTFAIKTMFIYFYLNIIVIIILS